MATTDNPMAAHLPAQFLAYKQKAEEQANAAPRMGNANCWGSFSFMTGDPRTSVSSTGIGSHSFNHGDMQHNSERSLGAPSSPSEAAASPRASAGLINLDPVTESRLGSMLNKFSLTAIKSKVTGVEEYETHSAEVKQIPTNSQMTNVDRLKSMAAASVSKPEIPDAPEMPPQQQHQAPPPANYRTQSSFHKQSSFSQSSFPSLASSNSDGSSSLESTASGRLWSMGSKFFKPKTPTGIGSHQDPSIGELNKGPKSFFPSSMSSLMIKKPEEKKDIDIEKLKRLRDQAAGLVPQSPTAAPKQEEKKEEEKVETLESQIDDLEKEMGLNAPAVPATPPRLRMDGFDDVHEEEKKYAEIKVTPQAVSHLDAPFGITKNMPSPLSQIGNSPQQNGGLSTAL